MLSGISRAGLRTRARTPAISLRARSGTWATTLNLSPQASRSPASTACQPTWASGSTPRIRRNGTTDGHVVVWTSSFRRLIDLTVGQDPQLQRAARQNPQLALPVVGQVDEFLAFRERCAVRTERPPFTFTYRLLPQYTRFVAPLWENADVTEQLDLAALALAHDTLELVRATESRRRRATGNKIRALLDGKAQLPPLPAAA